MRMGIHLAGPTVGRPTGMSNSGGSQQGTVFQDIRQRREFTFRATAVEASAVNGGDPGAVVPPVFQPLERIHENGRRGPFLRDDTDNAAHGIKFLDLKG